MTDLKPIRISLFGDGCRLHVGTFNEREWLDLNLAAEKLNHKLTSAIFDPSFYELISNSQIKSISDLGNKYRFSGLVNSYKSLIQIQVYRKRRRNIQFNDLYGSDTLFPIYNTIVVKNSFKLPKNSILVIEEDIGLFSKFLATPPFVLDKLDFEINKIEIGNHNFELLSSLYYNEVKLESTQSNSLISRQYSIIFTDV